MVSSIWRSVCVATDASVLGGAGAAAEAGAGAAAAGALAAAGAGVAGAFAVPATMAAAVGGAVGTALPEALSDVGGGGRLAGAGDLGGEGSTGALSITASGLPSRASDEAPTTADDACVASARTNKDSILCRNVITVCICVSEDERRAASVLSKVTSATCRAAGSAEAGPSSTWAT